MLIEILLLLVVLFLAFYKFTTRNFNRFKEIGIPFAKPSFPFGSFDFLKGEHVDTLSLEHYKQFPNEKYFGCFFFGKPMFAVTDPNVLRVVQVKDFDVFVDRIDKASNEKMFKGGYYDNIWNKQLTSLSGDEWKDVRAAFTPIFTSGKMKMMLKFIQHVSRDLLDEFEKKAKVGEEFELKSVFGKFSLDALASSAFGVNAETFTNKDSKFVEHAEKIFSAAPMQQMWLLIRLIPGIPDLLQALKISTNQPKSTKFFVDIIMQSIKRRKETKEKRNDMIDLMIESIKEDSNVHEDDDDKGDQYENDMKIKNSKRKQLDEEMIVSTAMVLLVAGYDTTGMTLSYLAYEMANNPEIQERLQEEIDQAFDEAGDKFPDYNVIQSLPYLDMVIHETLRFHPPVGMNFRNAERDYQLPDSNLIIRKSECIVYNARHLHRLPEHWSHPDEFYPEHFSKEEKAERNPYVFQAFGQGPRACIGMRFALLEAKVATMAVLRKFSFKPGTKTITPLKIDNYSQLAYPKGGLWVKIEERS